MSPPEYKFNLNPNKPTQRSKERSEQQEEEPEEFCEYYGNFIELSPRATYEVRRGILFRRDAEGGPWVEEPKGCKAAIGYLHNFTKSGTKQARMFNKERFLERVEERLEEWLTDPEIGFFSTDESYDIAKKLFDDFSQFVTQSLSDKAAPEDQEKQVREYIDTLLANDSGEPIAASFATTVARRTLDQFDIEQFISTVKEKINGLKGGVVSQTTITYLAEKLFEAVATMREGEEEGYLAQYFDDIREGAPIPITTDRDFEEELVLRNNAQYFRREDGIWEEKEGEESDSLKKIQREDEEVLARLERHEKLVNTAFRNIDKDFKNRYPNTPCIENMTVTEKGISYTISEKDRTMYRRAKKKIDEETKKKDESAKITDRYASLSEKIAVIFFTKMAIIDHQNRRARVEEKEGHSDKLSFAAVRTHNMDDVLRKRDGLLLTRNGTLVAFNATTTIIERVREDGAAYTSSKKMEGLLTSSAEETFFDITTDRNGSYVLERSSSHPIVLIAITRKELEELIEQMDPNPGELSEKEKAFYPVLAKRIIGDCNEMKKKLRVTYKERFTQSLEECNRLLGTMETSIEERDKARNRMIKRRESDERVKRVVEERVKRQEEIDIIIGEDKPFRRQLFPKVKTGRYYHEKLIRGEAFLEVLDNDELRGILLEDERLRYPFKNLFLTLSNEVLKSLRDNDMFRENCINGLLQQGILQDLRDNEYRAHFVRHLNENFTKYI